jgi:protein tyrosine/serine phosphatase
MGINFLCDSYMGTPPTSCRSNTAYVVSLSLVVSLALCLVVCRGAVTADDGISHERWAQKILSPHLKNFHKVSEDLYRGAQPSITGMRELEQLGIRTVINLRSWHSDQTDLDGTSLRYERIKMNAALPRDEEVVRFLQIVGKRENGPFFVHCQHGADRTGTMCAIYRMAFQGWKKDEAIAELTRGGFGFHRIWNTTLIPYLRQLDMDDLKEKASLK